MEVLTINVARAPEVVAIGNARENIASEIAFDYSPWVKRFGEGTCYLHVQRPQDANPYEAVLEEDETSGRVIWRPTNADTDFTGRGRAQFVFMSGEVKARSVTFYITSAGSLDATGDPPEPWETWMDALEDLADETTLNAREARSAANAAAQSAEAADNSAAAALQSESNAKDSEDAAKTSEETAAAQAQNAGSAAATAAAAATDAQRYAANAAASASSAESSASAADNSRAAAASAAQTAGQAASNANSYASTAAAKATEASGSAATAAQKASDASASATAAASSATSATSAASNAASSATSASTSATNAGNAQTAAEAAQTAAEAAKTAAETAQGKAEDAQEAAETAAQSIEDSAAQIDENTAGLVELRSALNTKAGIIRDTVSGSVASFVPDATVPNLLGLDVHLDPIQDLHGYDSPWPAGGGVNILPFIGNNETTKGVTVSYDDTSQCYTMNGTKTSGGDLLLSSIPPSQLPISTDLTGTKFYTLSVSVVSGSMTLGTGTGITFAVALFNSNASSYIRTNTTSTTLDGYLGYKQEGTPTTGNYQLLFQCWREGTVFDNLKFRVQIEIADNHVPTVWHPYSNLCPISGRESVEVEAAGKNLFDESQKSMLACYADGGAAQTRRGVKLWLPAGTYTIKATRAAEGNGYIYCNIVNKDGSYAEFRYFITGGGSTLPATQTFTLTEGQSFILFDQQASAESSVDKMAYYHYMIVSGSTGADYEPYVGTTHTISLPETVYGGDIGVVSGDGANELAAINLSNLTWSANSTYPHTYNGEGFVSRKQLIDGSLANRCYCSRYKWYTSSQVGSSDFGIALANAYAGDIYAKTRIYVSDARFSTVEEFVASFSEDDPIVVCPLATPTSLPTTPTDINTVEGQNNVFSPDGDVTVEYAADLKTYIDNKIAAAVAALS